MSVQITNRRCKCLVALRQKDAQTDDVRHVSLTAVTEVIRQTDDVHVLLTAVTKVIRRTDDVRHVSLTAVNN